MKRTSWISWRLYFFTIPVNVVILILAGDHILIGWKDIALWGLVALISHAAIAPFISVMIPASQYFNNWKVDLIFLLIVGALRGVAINICVDRFNLIQEVSDAYKILNSAIALPLWFIVLAVFIESRQEYQHEFQSLFTKAMRKERETQERYSLLPKGESSAEELIARLQFITSKLASDIQILLKRPDVLKDYSLEANRIQHLIDDDLRPASAELWESNTVSTPKISIVKLIQITMLEQRLRAIPVVLLSAPYLFVAVNGTYGFQIAVTQVLVISFFDISVYVLFESLAKFFKFTRKQCNLSILLISFFLPLFSQIVISPKKLYGIDDGSTVFIYQFVLSLMYQIFLFATGSIQIIKQQRSEVIASLTRHLSSDKYSVAITAGGATIRNSEIAEYLHGEVQAGLTASSLLLQQAAQSGDSDLANEALERAAGLLSQDHTNISYTRMAKPEIRIAKIIAGWKGIADISISLPPTAQLDEVVLRNSVTLIEEAIANSIRHAHATEIKVSSILKQDLFTINVISNGDSMVKGKAGLGTKLFDDLTSEWSYTTESGQNRLTFVLVNKL
jgi:signal transduction histidine kinase